ncbi:hypothetical protein BC939DRAFT_526252 [Gamsiella multidivaricata]|uniref:uncharacterized protein n=1 Tax=Gamsiella multidivaricata TaxID=101098 RepID=UPI00221ED8B5|nr:uncharacterized protein BC939DRAFT_526252 [Gamsiella multidivaricata]KAI7829395.1 hypothetical protein BC939DRAFT_526252 [Gamsiella multidivaricata]
MPAAMNVLYSEISPMSSHATFLDDITQQAEKTTHGNGIGHLVSSPHSGQTVFGLDTSILLVDQMSQLDVENVLHPTLARKTTHSKGRTCSIGIWSPGCSLSAIKRIGNSIVNVTKSSSTIFRSWSTNLHTPIVPLNLNENVTGDQVNIHLFTPSVTTTSQEEQTPYSSHTNGTSGSIKSIHSMMHSVTRNPTFHALRTDPCTSNDVLAVTSGTRDFVSSRRQLSLGGDRPFQSKVCAPRTVPSYDQLVTTVEELHAAVEELSKRIALITDLKGVSRPSSHPSRLGRDYIYKPKASDDDELQLPGENIHSTQQDQSLSPPPGESPSIIPRQLITGPNVLSIPAIPQFDPLLCFESARSAVAKTEPFLLAPPSTFEASATVSAEFKHTEQTSSRKIPQCFTNLTVEIQQVLESYRRSLSILLSPVLSQFLAPLTPRLTAGPCTQWPMEGEPISLPASSDQTDAALFPHSRRSSRIIVSSNLESYLPGLTTHMGDEAVIDHPDGDLDLDVPVKPYPDFFRHDQARDGMIRQKNVGCNFYIPPAGGMTGSDIQARLEQLARLSEEQLGSVRRSEEHNHNLQESEEQSSINKSASISHQESDISRSSVRIGDHLQELHGCSRSYVKTLSGSLEGSMHNVAQCPKRISRPDVSHELFYNETTRCLNKDENT